MNGDEAAFPTMEIKQVGLTKREWLAGMALQGLLAYPDNFALKAEDWAVNAVIAADALLAELAKPSEAPRG